MGFTTLAILLVVAVTWWVGNTDTNVTGKVLETIPHKSLVAVSLGRIHGVRIGDDITVQTGKTRFDGEVTRVVYDVSVVKLRVGPVHAFPTEGDLVIHHISVD